MEIVLEIPDDIGRELEIGRHDLSRTAVEALALEGYRSGKLSESQVRTLLGLSTRYEVHGFLKEHSVPLRYSEGDLDRDIDNARTFGEKWSSSQTPHR